MIYRESADPFSAISKKETGGARDNVCSLSPIAQARSFVNADYRILEVSIPLGYGVTGKSAAGDYPSTFRHSLTEISMPAENPKPSSFPDRICFVSHDSTEPYGSTKSFIGLLAAATAEDRVHSSFLFGRGVARDFAASTGVTVQSFEYTCHHWPGKTLRRVGFIIQRLACFFQLLKFFRANGVELVYVNTCFFTLPMLAGFMAGKPVVVHMRDSAHYLRGQSIYRKLKRLILKKCVSKYIAISRNAASDLRRYVGDVNISLVYNGLDFRPAHASKSLDMDASHVSTKKYQVLTVNRIDPMKGVEDLIAIAKQVHSIRQDVEFTLLGGPLDSKYYTEVIEKLLEDMHYFRVVGFKDDVYPFLLNADLFLNTTLGEQFGRSNVEAMAVGLTVVSRNCGAIPEIIEDGKNGVLFDTEDTDGVPRLIVDLLDDRDRRKRLGDAASADVRRRFSIENHLAEIKSVLRSVQQ